MGKPIKFIQQFVLEGDNPYAAYLVLLSCYSDLGQYCLTRQIPHL